VADDEGSDFVKNMQSKLDAWSAPLSVDAYLAEADAAALAAARRLLAATNQWGSSDSKQRIVLIDVSEGGPAVPVVDRWLAPADVDVLVQRLAERRPVVRGKCDAMYATGWSYAWFRDGDDRFEIWQHGGRAVMVDGEQIVTAERGLARTTVEAVVGWVSDDWCQREVQLRLHGDEIFTLARELDELPSVDFTYDGLHLMADTCWIRSLGRTLAEMLGVPYDDKTD